MKKLIPLVAALLLLCGCAQFGRIIADGGAAAGGAFLGQTLSHGNAAATAGGAAAGVLLSEGVQAWQSSSKQKSFEQGFQSGQVQGVKDLYWDLQNQQKNKPAQ